MLSPIAEVKWNIQPALTECCSAANHSKPQNLWTFLKSMLKDAVELMKYRRSETIFHKNLFSKLLIKWVFKDISTKTRTSSYCSAWLSVPCCFTQRKQHGYNVIIMKHLPQHHIANLDVIQQKQQQCDLKTDYFHRFSLWIWNVTQWEIMMVCGWREGRGATVHPLRKSMCGRWDLKECKSWKENTWIK